ncbi:hypothetical protein L596_025342 [Steinernema carpocapsae]|uniref:Uncharacterized protein n=1 Tax=Steinernema carpocapsae TaxID=34508 RepID=A0A4V6XVR9_STECR|nr:hypothetical protein L596_025342 [Steinernema carpocapsae]
MPHKNRPPQARHHTSMFVLLAVAFTLLASPSQGSPPSPGCIPYTCVSFTPQCLPGFNLIPNTASACSVAPQYYRYCAPSWWRACNWSPCMEWNTDHKGRHYEACERPVAKSSWFCCPE